ncbi:MAG: hypothetical protein H6Q70_2327 [Firmicutes bacterium]|nr:hypothetical protein [Bacillota bacterium]
MYRIYKTKKDTIIAEEEENADLTVKLITDLDKKEYFLVKRQKEVAIYNLSLVAQVTEIVNDVSFEEFRNIIYAKLGKESLEQELKPNSMDSLKFDWKYFAETGTTGG